jgi:lipopolysaccharide transport system ATP-binding protein
MTRQEIRRRLDEIISFSGCEAFIETPVKRYSSGMMVRLGFAVAAYLECEILVVDEVLAVGDMEFQRKCIGRIRDVSQSGRTVLFVSHNMGSVETLCTDAIRIEGGRLVDHASPTTVVQRYLEDSAEQTQKLLAEHKTQFIQSVRLFDESGRARNQFLVGETIIFEAELSAASPIVHPRFGFVISKPGLGRLATLHTDVQYNYRWSIAGSTVVRVVWKNVPLNVGDYSIDASLWRHDAELETLIGCTHLVIEMRDVYGTGALPDPVHQGPLIADARWEITTGESC